MSEKLTYTPSPIFPDDLAPAIRDTLKSTQLSIYRSNDRENPYTIAKIGLPFRDQLQRELQLVVGDNGHDKFRAILLAINPREKSTIFYSSDSVETIEISGNAIKITGRDIRPGLEFINGIYLDSNGNALNL